MNQATKKTVKQLWIKRSLSAVYQKGWHWIEEIGQNPLRVQIQLLHLGFGAFYAMPEPIFRRYDLLIDASQNKAETLNSGQQEMHEK